MNGKSFGGTNLSNITCKKYIDPGLKNNEYFLTGEFNASSKQDL
jgi:hypothetical protein